MRKRILILDDCLNCLENYLELLELEGFQVIGSASASEALQIVKQEAPSLLICDIKMSETDGFGFIRTLKDCRISPAIPFIFHSAVTEPPQVREAMTLGAKAFLAKPCPTDLYVTTVHDQLSSGGLIST